MEIETFRVGLVGFGMGKTYAAALKTVNLFYPAMPPIELYGVATSSIYSSKLAHQRFNFKVSTTDYMQLLQHAEINTILITVPNAMHHPILLQALSTDKFILSDKPLAANLEQALEIYHSARALNRDTGMLFEFRFSPAMQTARQMIADGRLGDIYSFRAEYFRPSYVDPQRPLRWKASAAQGAGALGDLGAHLIDLVTWLLGPVSQVCAQKRIFIKERPVGVGPSDRGKVESDDHTIVQACLASGAIGTIEAGRLVTGSVNDVSLAIYGSQGSLRWNLMSGDYLYYADGRGPANERGWLQIPTVQRYLQAELPPADFTAGKFRYIVAAMADFLNRTLTDQPYDPGLRQGTRVQAIIEAAERSHTNGGWEDVMMIA